MLVLSIGIVLTAFDIHINRNDFAGNVQKALSIPLSASFATSDASALDKVKAWRGAFKDALGTC
jgi:hypothetical protein